MSDNIYVTHKHTASEPIDTSFNYTNDDCLPHIAGIDTAFGNLKFHEVVINSESRESPIRKSLMNQIYP